jgi:hypothetical protein
MNRHSPLVLHSEVVAPHSSLRGSSRSSGLLHSTPAWHPGTWRVSRTLAACLWRATGHSRHVHAPAAAECLEWHKIVRQRDDPAAVGPRWLVGCAPHGRRLRPRPALRRRPLGPASRYWCQRRLALVLRTAHRKRHRSNSRSRRSTRWSGSDRERGDDGAGATVGKPAARAACGGSPKSKRRQQLRRPVSLLHLLAERPRHRGARPPPQLRLHER